MTSNIPADEEPLDFLREIILEQDSELTTEHPHEVTKEQLAAGVFAQLDPDDHARFLQAILPHWAADEIMSFLASSVEAKHRMLHRDCCYQAETLEDLDFETPDISDEHGPHNPHHHNGGI